MAYGSVGGLGAIKDTGIVGTYMGAQDVFVYTFKLTGVSLRTPDDLSEVVQAVAGGAFSLPPLVGPADGEAGKAAFAARLGVDACGIAVSGIGANAANGVTVAVVFRNPDQTGSAGHFVGSLTGLTATVSDITHNATAHLRATWSGATIADPVFGRIVDNDQAVMWWLRQPILWSSHATDVAPDMAGSPTQALAQPTTEQMLVGNVERPEQALPMNAAFRKLTDSSGKGLTVDADGVRVSGGGSGGEEDGGGNAKIAAFVIVAAAALLIYSKRKTGRA